eukprot:65678-Amphidinium_carterae.2
MPLMRRCTRISSKSLGSHELPPHGMFACACRHATSMTALQHPRDQSGGTPGYLGSHTTLLLLGARRAHYEWIPLVLQAGDREKRSHKAVVKENERITSMAHR